MGGVSGLLMQMTLGGGRTWLLRVAVGGKRREIGLGGFPDVTLAMARDRTRTPMRRNRADVAPGADDVGSEPGAESGWTGSPGSAHRPDQP